MSGERKLFGTDGIRGTANVHPMTPEVALALGRAIAHVFREHEGQRKQILIGKDTRLSGYMFEDALGRRHLFDGRERDPGGSRADPGARVPDPRHALQRRRHDHGQSQSLPGQRHQVLRRRRLQAARRGRGTHRGAGRKWRGLEDLRAARRDRSGPSHRRRPRSLRRVPEEHLSARPHPRRHAHRDRLRQRRGLSRGSRLSCRSSGPRCLRSASSRTDATSTRSAARSIPSAPRPRYGSCGPTSGSPSTAMRIG